MFPIRNLVNNLRFSNSYPQSAIKGVLMVSRSSTTPRVVLPLGAEKTLRKPKTFPPKLRRQICAEKFPPKIFPPQIVRRRFFGRAKFRRENCVPGGRVIAPRDHQKNGKDFFLTAAKNILRRKNYPIPPRKKCFILRKTMFLNTF